MDAKKYNEAFIVALAERFYLELTPEEAKNIFQKEFLPFLEQIKTFEQVDTQKVDALHLPFEAVNDETVLFDDAADYHSELLTWETLQKNCPFTEDYCIIINNNTTNK